MPDRFNGSTRFIGLDVIKRLPGFDRSPPFDDGVIPTWTREDVPRLKLFPYVREPFEVIEPTTPRITDPGIAICPDSSEMILWFRPTRLELTDFSLTVRREVRPDGSVATSGATAILSVSVYAQKAVADIAYARDEWLAVSKVPVRQAAQYVILPVAQYGLSVALDLPSGVASAEPTITVSPLAGAATIAVELSETGALAWRTALEQGAGATIPGRIRAVVSIPSSNTFNDRGTGLWYPTVETYPIDTAVGTLLASRGVGDIQQIDPQQTVQAIVLVVGSQLVTRSTVTMRPSLEQAPASAAFTATGGRLDMSVVTQHPDEIHVDWRAEVAFTPPRWPTIPMSGRLDTSAGWVAMIKPESWCVSYLLAIIPVDASGRPVHAAARSGDRVQGVLNFTAPYVSGGLLSTAFEAEYGRPTSLVLPRYPGEPFGDLVITVFATVGGTMGQASRRLSADEVVVTGLAFPDGRVQLQTSQDTLPEAQTGVASLIGGLEKLL